MAKPSQPGLAVNNNLEQPKLKFNSGVHRPCTNITIAYRHAAKIGCMATSLEKLEIEV